jgi:hypothetical protein
MALESALPTSETPSSNGTEQAQEQPSGGTQATPDLDPRYAGKSPQELVEIIKEKEKFIGTQSNEAVGRVRQLEDRLNYIQQAIESRPVQQAEPPRQARQFDITEPERYINETVDEKLTRFGQFLAQRDAQREQRESISSFESGKRSAMKEDPRLYEGIEGTVEQAIRLGLGQRVIDPITAANPETWKAVARHLRLERGEYDRVVPQNKKPMSATATAMPSATRANQVDDDIELTDDDRIAVKQWGLTEKEYVESVRRGRQMARKGELK